MKAIKNSWSLVLHINRANKAFPRLLWPDDINISPLASIANDLVWPAIRMRRREGAPRARTQRRPLVTTPFFHVVVLLFDVMVLFRLCAPRDADAGFRLFPPRSDAIGDGPFVMLNGRDKTVSRTSVPSENMAAVDRERDQSGVIILSNCPRQTFPRRDKWADRWPLPLAVAFSRSSGCQPPPTEFIFLHPNVSMCVISLA